MKNKLFSISVCIFLVILLNPLITKAYKIDQSKEVHQYITKEATNIWKPIPYEIRNHTNNSINTPLDGEFTLDSEIYDQGDDVITGSAEQDRIRSTMVLANTNHFWNPDNTVEPRVVSTTVMKNDTFYHVAAAYNGTHLAMYVNGEFENRQARIGAIKQSTSNLFIGSAGGTSAFWNGTIDEVAVYNRSLSPFEIKQLYLRTWYDVSPEVLLWHADNASNGLVNATSLGSHQATASLVGGVNCTVGVSGVYGQACQFNGTSGYVNVPYSESLNVSSVINGDQLTVELWAKGVDYGKEAHLINKVSNDFFIRLGPAGEVRMQCFVTNEAGIEEPRAQTSFENNTWTYWACVYNGANVKLYKNGMLASTSSAKTGRIRFSNNPITVGGVQSSSVFNGSIDELRISRKALTAQEINESFSKDRQFYSNEYLLNSSNYRADDTLKLEYSPRDSNGTVGAALNSSGLNVHALKMADEADGDVAIEAGINSSLPAAIKYVNQQVYVVNLSGNHVLGGFDRVAASGSQRWLINYITAGESYVSAPNLTAAVYVLEITDKTSGQITDEVSRFINATRS